MKTKTPTAKIFLSANFFITDIEALEHNQVIETILVAEKSNFRPADITL